MAGPKGHTARLPIACVEGWSQEPIGAGCAARPARGGRRPSRRGRAGPVPPARRLLQRPAEPIHARDPDTLLALELNGAPLHPDHGFPVRLIAPTNPGVMQTKWLESVTVL